MIIGRGISELYCENQLVEAAGLLRVSGKEEITKEGAGGVGLKPSSRPKRTNESVGAAGRGRVGEGAGKWQPTREQISRCAHAIFATLLEAGA
jgi:hypothetical protein